jgi:hypothetical protein
MGDGSWFIVFGLEAIICLVNHSYEPLTMNN